jgi:hypothetical protein
VPDLIKLYIKHSVIGFAIAAAFVAMLLYFNVQNLWHLVTHSDVGLLAVFLLWFMNGIIFAGVQFAWAIMHLAKDDRDDDHHGGSGVRDLIAIRVPSEKPQDTHRKRLF